MIMNDYNELIFFRLRFKRIKVSNDKTQNHFNNHNLYDALNYEHFIVSNIFRVYQGQHRLWKCVIMIVHL